MSNYSQPQKLMIRILVMSIFITFTQFTHAQSPNQTLKMTNGTYQVPSTGYNFYDSGGPLLFDPAVDPGNANEYNWTTWYQHNEEYTLTLTVPEGKGVKVAFSKLLINNDFLYFYEGNVADEDNLISILTCNDYSNSLDDFTVVSHGNMTIRFESDYHWRDEGWVATINQTDEFVPQAPVAAMAACANQMVLIPTCNADDGGTLPMQYKLNGNSWQDYTTTGVWVDLSSQSFPLTVKTRTKIDEETFSDENTFTFNAITAPGNPTYNHNASSNTVTTYFPLKPDGVNDTYYLRWTINTNSNGATENPNFWEQAGHEFQQPSNTPNTVPAGDIDYTNVTLSMPFYVHFAVRGTTCPENFSGVVTVRIDERYVPKPTISFETSGNNGMATLSCSLDDATIANPTASPMLPTEYTVTVSDSERNIAVATVFVDIRNVNTSENVLQHVKVYPNPSDGHFRIDGLQGTVTYCIMNSLGQVVLEGQSEGDLDLETRLPKGIYFLRLENGSNTSTLKIAVK